jgi:t-SNARE complex subunit (syntaxin)
MFNRLSELRGGRIEEDDDNDYASRSAPVNYDESSLSKETDAFLKKIKELDLDLEEIDKNCTEIERNQNLLMQSTTTQKNRVVKQTIDKLAQNAKAKCKAAKEKLDKLQASTADFKKTKQPGNTEVRLREQQQQNSLRRFADLLKRYHTIQEHFQDDLKDRIERQAKMTGVNLDPNEVDQLVKQAEFKITFSKSQKSTINAVYAEVLETNKDVVNLMQEFHELNELFADFAHLVQSQDEMVDHISVSVGKAADMVEDATENIQTSKRHQEKSRRTLCITLIIIVIVAVAITLAILILTGTLLGILLKQ